MPYATRTDLENVFGAVNVAKWADLDNLANAVTIAARIAWALGEATTQLDSRLAGGLYAVPFTDTPAELVTPCAQLAGCLLYDSRGISDTNNDGDPVNQLAPHRTMVDKFVSQVRTGKRRLVGIAMLTTVPEVGTFD